MVEDRGHWTERGIEEERGEKGMGKRGEKWEKEENRAEGKKKGSEKRLERGRERGERWREKEK